ncbi:MAG: 4'-phosphopantetheinyl transferase superfamily protein [Chloroflexi bacterium]|nr:4'-phosphopantetheinyl transferase superfamily protein [Chloroflexota bacterium]
MDPEARPEFVVRTGIDLVKLADFARSLEQGGETFLRRLFHPSETAGASLERLAGFFAAKEAAFKAMDLPKGDWHILEIRIDGEGRPAIVLSPNLETARPLTWDLSISHCGDYALASVVAIWPRAAAQSAYPTT